MLWRKIWVYFFLPRLYVYIYIYIIYLNCGHNFYLSTFGTINIFQPRHCQMCLYYWNLHRQLNKKRPIVWNYLWSPFLQSPFYSVSCFMIGFWKNHQTFFYTDGIFPLLDKHVRPEKAERYRRYKKRFGDFFKTRL